MPLSTSTFLAKGAALPFRGLSELRRAPPRPSFISYPPSPVMTGCAASNQQIHQAQQLKQQQQQQQQQNPSTNPNTSIDRNHAPSHPTTTLHPQLLRPPQPIQAQISISTLHPSAPCYTPLAGCRALALKYQYILATKLLKSFAKAAAFKWLMNLK